MSEQTSTADLTTLARAIIDLLPLSDDGTAHVADCGYTHDNPTCGCYSLPSRIAEQITAAGFGPVRAVEAERDAAEFKFEHAHKGANLYRERAERAEAERDALRERVTAMHQKATVWSGSNWVETCHHDQHTWPCPTLALLATSPDREGDAS